VLLLLLLLLLLHMILPYIVPRLINYLICLCREPCRGQACRPSSSPRLTSPRLAINATLTGRASHSSALLADHSASWLLSPFRLQAHRGKVVMQQVACSASYRQRCRGATAPRMQPAMQTDRHGASSPQRLVGSAASRVGLPLLAFCAFLTLIKGTYNIHICRLAKLLIWLSRALTCITRLPSSMPACLAGCCHRDVTMQFDSPLLLV